MDLHDYRERVVNLLINRVLDAWSYMSLVYSFLGSVGSGAGKKLIWIIGHVLETPTILPLLLVQRLVPRAEPVLNPIIWMFRYLLFWYPLAIWRRICSSLDWLLKWAFLSLILSVGALSYLTYRLFDYIRMVGGFAFQPRYSAIVSTYNRGLELGRTLAYSVVAVMIIGSGFLSQVAYWVGRLFILVDIVIDWMMNQVFTQSDLENLEQDYRYYAEHAYGGEFLEGFEGISHRRLLQDSIEEQRESLEIMAHGEFLLSILITIMALSLSFLPGLRTITLYEASFVSMEFRLSLLLSLQLFLAASTIALLVSVIIRTKVVDFLTIDDVSIFDDKEAIITAAITNSELGASFSSVLMGVFYTEDWYGTTEEFDYEKVEATQGLPLRDKLLYYVHAGIRDAQDDAD